MEKIKVLILEKKLKDRLDLENQFESLENIVMAPVPENLAGAMILLSKNEADVVLISYDYEGDGYAVSAQIRLNYPRKAIIIIEKEFNDATISNTIAAGARDVLIRPFKADKLQTSIIKAFNLVQEIATQVEIREHKKKGFKSAQIHTVFSTKGGTGKTFFAINLAVALARNTGKKVGLLDFDLDYGGVSMALDLQPKNTIKDVVAAIDHIDKDNIEPFMTTHESGVRVLAGTMESLEGDSYFAQQIETIMKALYDNFDYLVIDMPDRFMIATTPALNYAKKLYLLVKPEISSMTYGKVALKTLAEFNFPMEKVKLVLNMEHRMEEISRKDIERTLLHDLNYSIKGDAKAVASMNLGIPYVDKYPKSDTTKGFLKIVKDIAEDK